MCRRAGVRERRLHVHDLLSFVYVVSTSFVIYANYEIMNNEFENAKTVAVEQRKFERKVRETSCY